MPIRSLSVVVLASLMTGLGTRAASQTPPPPPTGPGQAVAIPPMSDEAKSRVAAQLCPIKGNWTLHVVKVGMGTDWNFTSEGGDGRYCVRPDDYQMCLQHNPTPDIPCKLVQPFIGRGGACTLQPQYWIEKSKLSSAAGWTFVDRDARVFVTPYVCDRAYKMDSCRYWYASMATTLFSNKGFASVDRKVTVEVSTCALDEAANALYLQKRKQGAVNLTALLKLKKGVWASRCAAVAPACHAAVDRVYKNAETEAWNIFEFPHDGDASAVMRDISAKYDPLAPRPPK